MTNIMATTTLARRLRDSGTTVNLFLLLQKLHIISRIPEDVLYVGYEIIGPDSFGGSDY